MKYNIFDTREAAENARQYDFEGYKSDGFSQNVEYWTNVTLYPEIKQKGGKWIYPVVSHSDAKHETMEF
jgi:hypothetical protein